MYSTQITFNNKNQVDLSFFLLQSPPEFITFHKSKHKSQRCLDKKDEIVNSAKKNDISTLDYSQCFNQSNKTNCIKRMVDSKTIDLHNNPRLVYKSNQSNTSRQSRPVDNKVQRNNQDSFLPRTAWTDVSGSDDWLQNDNSQNSE